MASLPVYATSGELATWTNSVAPTDAAALLRTASILVSQATLSAVYAVDDDGNATDQDVIDALRDATCAHAAALSANGIAPAAGPAGVTGPVSASGIGSGSVTFAAPANAAGLAQSLLTELAPEAAMILFQAGLFNQVPTSAQG